MITCRDNLDKMYTYTYTGQVAMDYIRFINTANFTIKSLHKRILERLATDGIVPGGGTVIGRSRSRRRPCLANLAGGRMTRVLEFSGPRAPKRFQLLWAALMSGGDGKGDRTPVVIRKEARLQDLLESISDQVSANGTEPDRALKDGESKLMVAQEDFELLVQYHRKDGLEPTHLP